MDSQWVVEFIPIALKKGHSLRVKFQCKQLGTLVLQFSLEGCHLTQLCSKGLISSTLKKTDLGIKFHAVLNLEFQIFMHIFLRSSADHIVAHWKEALIWWTLCKLQYANLHSWIAPETVLQTTEISVCYTSMPFIAQSYVQGRHCHSLLNNWKLCESSPVSFHRLRLSLGLEDKTEGLLIHVEGKLGTCVLTKYCFQSVGEAFRNWKKPSSTARASSQYLHYDYKVMSQPSILSCCPCEHMQYSMSNSSVLQTKHLYLGPLVLEGPARSTNTSYSCLPFCSYPKPCKC